MGVSIEGTCDRRFAPVRDAFHRCFAELDETGAAVCVYHEGQPVADLWGGVADAATGRLWTRDTMVHVYSVTKPFAAACLLKLVDEGRVDLDVPVAHYWPDFAQAGKSAIPVRWLLTHQAGLLGIRDPLPAESILDWDRITTCLATEWPWWPPGERHGEQALFFGPLVGEVVRRVTGRTVGQVLRDALGLTWDVDFHIGLDDDCARRCATVVGMDDAWRTALGVGTGSLYDQALGNPPGLLEARTINSDAWRRAEVPAINGHSSAHGVARFYAGLAEGGILDGVRILSESLVRSAATVQSSGKDVLLQRPVQWGLGVQVTSDGFGLGGLGGSLGWGNLEHRFGFGYVTHRMANHDRAMAVYEALADILGFAVDD